MNIYIYMYCMYIYNRVICMDFPETHIWIIYGIVFFLNSHISLILYLCSFSRTKEELSQHKGDWRAQQAAHASGGSVRDSEFRPAQMRPMGPEYLPTMDAIHLW